MKLGKWVVIAMLAAPFSLMAQQPAASTAAPAAAPAPAPSPWAGNVRLGYLATSGNTDNQTLNAGFEVGYTQGKWEHMLHGKTINASQDDETTADSFAVGWKSERNFTDHDFMFFRLNYIEDEFSGYATQFSQTVGYGRRLLDSDKFKLNAEVGVGARQSELQDTTEEDETVFRGALFFKWHISETAEFRQDLTAEGGEFNTLVVSVTELSAQLIGDLAIVASYTVKHNTDVPPLVEETDTYTALSLEYVF